MFYRLSVLLVAAFAVTIAFAQTSAPPEAPVNLKEAEAMGLQRVNVDELKTFVPGVHNVRGPTGAVKRTMQADGNMERKGFRDSTGKWKFDESKNAYCIELATKRGYQKECYGVFRAGQAGFFFDYDLATGYYSRTWTPLKDQ